MSSELFHIHKHTIPASHPRGFPRGVRSEETSRLHLCIKQYIPKSNPTPQPGDVTLLLAHGVGSTKESYEPLFDELLAALSSRPTTTTTTTTSPLRIRAIWAPDIAWHGASYCLNASAIGDTPHWDDAARDLLQLVNVFQAVMPLPIVAIGQSWGGHTVLRASLMHPRLFTGVVAIEPVVGTGWRGDGGSHGEHRAALIAKRRDRWPSREKAREALLQNPYFQRFDGRVFERVVKYDLVDVEGGGVELTTPKAMELATMMREVPEGHAVPKVELVIPGFYRPETNYATQRLPDVAAPCLYVWGTESDVALKEDYRDNILLRTGSGEFGSGGIEKGRVEEIWVKGASHPIPLEMPKEAAEAIVPWISREVERWKREETQERMRRGGQLWVKTIDPRWMEKITKL